LAKSENTQKNGFCPGLPKIHSRLKIPSDFPGGMLDKNLICFREDKLRIVGAGYVPRAIFQPGTSFSRASGSWLGKRAFRFQPGRRAAAPLRGLQMDSRRWVRQQLP
jgi:hypothetical protein